MDINDDGFPDIVSGGNQFDFLPQLERLDASCGDILINGGKGNASVSNTAFKWTEPAQTGLNLRGQLRDIAEIHARSKRFLLFLQNDEFPVMYQFNGDKTK
jgi:hypothetical protein